MSLLNEAMNPIKALARQATSYSGSVARAGIRTANVITRDALSHGMKYYAAGGAVLGAAAGGYNAYDNGTGMVSGALKGAAYGAAGGAAVRMGMSAGRGARSMRALGMRLRGGVGGGMSGAAAKAAGSTNYFRAMSGDFERAGGFSSMKSAARMGYGRGRSSVMAGVNGIMGSAAAGRAADIAGKTVGGARGYGAYAAEYGRGAYNYAKTRMGM